MLTIGLDVHERTTSICILDERGGRVKELTVKGHPRRAVACLRELHEPFQVCFEASTNFVWFYRELIKIAKRVVVAHPRKLKLIYQASRKNDRLDASRLAKLLFVDEIPEVYVPSEFYRDWRSFIEFRKRCVDEQTRTKNKMRALLRTHGIEVPKQHGLWTKRGRQWLESLSFEGSAGIRRDVMLEDLAHFHRKIRRLEGELREIAKQVPAVVLLMTIPGVGIRTAEAFVAYVVDPRRFTSHGIGPYLGLVPRQDASAGINRMGRISREGPGTVRKMLAEASWQARRRSPSVRAFFDRVQGDRPDRRKRALIATAHYLARVMLAMMKTGETWREPQSVAQAA
jgi:transposase